MRENNSVENKLWDDHCGDFTPACGACVRHRAIRRGMGHKLYSGFSNEDLMELGGGLRSPVMPSTEPLSRTASRAVEEHSPDVILAKEDVEAKLVEWRAARGVLFEAKNRANQIGREIGERSGYVSLNPDGRAVLSGAHRKLRKEFREIEDRMGELEVDEANAHSALQRATARLLRAEAKQRIAARKAA